MFYYRSVFIGNRLLYMLHIIGIYCCTSVAKSSFVYHEVITRNAPSNTFTTGALKIVT